MKTKKKFEYRKLKNFKNFFKNLKQLLALRRNSGEVWNNAKVIWGMSSDLNVLLAWAPMLTEKKKIIYLKNLKTSGRMTHGKPQLKKFTQ